MSDRIQVILGPIQERPLIAGLPAALRAAQRVIEGVSPERMLLLGAGEEFARRWDRQLKGLGCGLVECLPTAAGGGHIDLDIPRLEIAADGLARAGALRRFCEAARDSARTTRWMKKGKTLAVYHPARGADGTSEQEAREDDWSSLESPGAAAEAERALFQSLTKDTDGYIARFDRRISIPISRLLLHTPVTPDHITTASLLLGLGGAGWLAFGSYPLQVLGAALLWFCCILDGCDGEVARLKMLCSKSGAAYDLQADHIAHLAVFVAIPLGVRTADPQARILLPGVLMVTGMLLSMFSVWRIFLRHPEEAVPPSARLFFERLASRDYVYLILFLVLIRKLNWFLWAAAFGAHAFNATLWWITLRRRLGPAGRSDGTRRP